MKGAKKLIRIESSEQSCALRRVFGFFVKVLISSLAIGFIAYKLNQRQSDLSLFLDHLLSLSFSEIALKFLIPSIALMILNWWMEVVKWKKLLDTNVEISWRISIKAVLSGTTIGVFSPNRMGEFVGRVLALKPEQRIKGSLLSMVNGLSQSLATFTFGVFGLLILVEEFAKVPLGFVGTKILQLTLVIAVVLAFTIYLRMNMLVKLPLRWKALAKYQHYFEVFTAVDAHLLKQLFNLSMVRFLTFILQYVVVFSLLLSSPNLLQVLVGSVLTLFSSTLLPFLPIPDLLVRESMALSYFQLYDFDPLIVSVAVLVVWLVNVALPALIGTSALFTYRIFKAK